MESIAEKLTLDKLDKSTWKTYRFDQIAKNISERVEPTQTNLEIYVGLDHIDSDSIHIKRFGKREDVSGTKLRCYPGDVIFGRRRAYQRKAAIATFDGFCSAHSLVLRANSEVILPELFPFFLHSDTFMHRAVDISVGSLSPTINWGDLKKQEFLLPPEDQQSQIAELLWAGDEANEVYLRLIQELKLLFDLKLTKAFSFPHLYFSEHSVTPLSEACTVQTGVAKGKRVESHEAIDLPYLSVANVQDGYLDLTSVKRITVTLKEKERFSLKSGDVLITEGGDFDKVGRGTIWQGQIEECLHQNHVFSVRPKSGIALSEFVSFQTGSKYGKTYFLKCAKKTSNLASINSTQVKQFPFILPQLSEQENFINEVSKIQSLQLKAEDSLTSLNRLQKSLINQFF